MFRLPLPIYYNGWVIQRHPPMDAYYVYQRVGSSKPCDILFEDLRDAKDYIDNETVIGAEV